MLRPIDEAAVDALNVERLARFRQPPAPAPQNVRNVARIGSWRLLGYGERQFLVPPVPAIAGARLDAIQRRFAEINRADPTPELVDEYVKLCGDVVTLAHRLVRHHRWRAKGWRGRMARWLWRRSRNPFRDASEGEIGMLLGFFSECRMMSSVRHH